MSIRILEDHVVNQIAAGEVVERPASVVKELLENALDAGARTIRIALRSGGCSLIRITDDGIGMDRADAMMCLERHATSKIRTAHDLEEVATLGFRGEAIPSIAAVSRFQIVSRPHDLDAGTKIRVEGGTLLDVSDTGCAPGTEIDVRSLFYNLPARRKFLRTKGTELSHCIEAVVREALAKPEVDFAVFHDDREVLRASAVPDQAVRARDLLGAWGQSLQPVQFSDRGYEVVGLVSPVGVHKSTPAGAMYLYVNGRYVRDPVVRRAVNEAYRELVPKGRYPVVVIDVRMPPGRVDVNVHPTKTEVRFHEPRDLTHIVASGLRDALQRHGIHRPVDRASRLPADPSAPTLPLYPQEPDPPPQVRQLAPAPRSVPIVVPAHPDDDLRFERTERPVHHVGPREDLAPEASPLVVAEQLAPELPALGRLLPVPRFRDLRVIGQLRNTYILCEGAGELVLIDQHAAHERVLLHRLLQNRDDVLGQPQRLLTPVLVDLPRARVAIVAEHIEVLEALRLEVEVFGPGEIALKAVPLLLKGADLRSLLADIADELAEGTSRSGEDLVRSLLATLACHDAVRANEPLGDYAMKSLLASLDEVDFEVCAHGRPVAVRIAATELERRFHRS